MIKNNEKMSKTKSLVIAALFAAITLVATMIKLPVPMTNGYINLGDCAVLLCGWILGPSYGFMAAGLGSALTDLIYGYTVYIPATFVIKGLMALLAYYISNKKILTKVISAVVAEAVMVLGYFLFEGFIYGFSGAIINIPGNSIQGLFGIVISIFIIKILNNKKW